MRQHWAENMSIMKRFCYFAAGCSIEVREYIFLFSKLQIIQTQHRLVYKNAVNLNGRKANLPSSRGFSPATGGSKFNKKSPPHGEASPRFYQQRDGPRKDPGRPFTGKGMARRRGETSPAQKENSTLHPWREVALVLGWGRCQKLSKLAHLERQGT
ncbi:hypothetical protein DQ04_13301000 [Trypanosoma grayi]|uniref:hypothetical protein n=1 Tax=Trypanosoma grayi TaxID=71804 RepID=UPI0004F41D29|nr:hypothetical protein DQ04_13301000 [Trypanosoma grayi]KEG06570.1 hypothetical protein DQ04_13301000 [Trypanosoma grayi]